MYTKETIDLIIPDTVIINKNLLENYEERLNSINNKINNLNQKFNINKKIKIVYLKEKEIQEFYKNSTYENTKENILILTKNKGKSIKKCPGTKNYLCCNYFIINLYVNCPLKCKYCFLQFYIKNPINTIYINIEDIFNQYNETIKRIKIKRIGTGELSDSLIFDPITEYSIDFVNFFKSHKETLFEFKTKTIFTDNLYKIEPSKNIVVGFSLNSESVKEENEPLTNTIYDRILEASKLSKYGYSVSFHFDPIFYYENYKEDYKKILNLIKENLDEKTIVWISLGTFRYHPEMKDILRINYPDEKITFNESISGFDNKIRYFYYIRKEIYSFFYDFFKNNLKVPIYLCMESKKLWNEIFRNKPKDIDNLKNIFNIEK
ncbi:MAG: DNA photolyase [Spirochaetes bacterium]|nr:DNA photolyase [Spirochaetota bacterium]